MGLEKCQEDFDLAMETKKVSTIQSTSINLLRNFYRNIKLIMMLYLNVVMMQIH